MTNLRIKLAVAGLVLAGAVSYLAYAGMQKGWVYTLGVDQYVAQTQQHEERIRLCGTVGTEQLEVRKAQLSAKFVIKGEHQQIPVAYKGVVPDMFKAGAEVIIEGKPSAPANTRKGPRLTRRWVGSQHPQQMPERQEVSHDRVVW